MLIVKSIAAGIGAMFAMAAGGAIVFVAILAFASRDLPPGQAIGWDPISLLRHSMIAWLVLVLGFGLGFVWKYRKG